MYFTDLANFYQMVIALTYTKCVKKRKKEKKNKKKKTDKMSHIGFQSRQSIIMAPSFSVPNIFLRVQIKKQLLGKNIDGLIFNTRNLL